MSQTPQQLISYIAPGAPARRKPATGDEPYLRPEIGFTPKWFRQRLDIDFGASWHTNPAYRRDTVVSMRDELLRRFPGFQFSWMDEGALDLLTGMYGGCPIPAIFGMETLFSRDGWPDAKRAYIGEDEMARLQAPDLDVNPFFQEMMRQVDWIAQREVQVNGYINWQGILNNALRLRGDQILTDLLVWPEKCRHLFDCIRDTMVEAARRLQQRKKDTGVHENFITVSNCAVNMVTPQMYREHLLPYDVELAEIFGCIGIHNCAWPATPYLDAYAEISYVGYIDMGLDSDLARARELFPTARRALMYTPMDLAAKTEDAISNDLRRIACEYGPCDVVAADIEAGTPDQRVQWFLDQCSVLSAEFL